MTGAKVTAIVLFGALSFLFTVLLTGGLYGALPGIVTGAITAGLVCVFIHFASVGRHAFARGFLGLGAVLIIVPIAAMAGIGEHVAETSIAALQSGESLSEEETTTLVLSSIFASAGLVFGIIVGLILVLIGGLMHRPAKLEPAP